MRSEKVGVIHRAGQEGRGKHLREYQSPDLFGMTVVVMAWTGGITYASRVNALVAYGGGTCDGSTVGREAGWMGILLARAWSWHRGGYDCCPRNASVEHSHVAGFCWRLFYSVRILLPLVPSANSYWHNT